MTNEQKQVLVASLKIAVKVAEAIEAKEAQDVLPTLPPIGAAYSNINIAGRLVALPFDEEEVIDVMKQINNAIQNESRVAGLMDNVTDVLSTVRLMLPMLLAL